MRYAIIGFGKIGQALAQAFARKGIAVTVASHRPPEALAARAAEIGASVTPRTLREAVGAEMVFLAVPYGEHREIAKLLPGWEGKIVVDAMNSLAPAEELDGLYSSAYAAKAFAGARYVKGFNHLGASKLASDPEAGGLHRVVFLASDDEAAVAPVAELAVTLGFAPVALGRFSEGGALVHAQNGVWGKLIFQDLFKKL